jgi:hypothetical protein
MIYYVPLQNRAPAIQPHRQEELPIIPTTSRPAPKRHPAKRTEPCGVSIAQKRAMKANQLKALLPPLPQPQPRKYTRAIKYAAFKDGFLSISQAWSRLFIVNEYLPARAKLEDDVILDRMYELFPLCKPGRIYSSKRFNDVTEMRRRFNQGRLVKTDLHSFRYKHEENMVFVFDGRRQVGWYEGQDPPDAPIRSPQAKPKTYETIYQQYKHQAALSKQYAEAVMIENERLRIEAEEMKAEKIEPDFSGDKDEEYVSA